MDRLRKVVTETPGEGGFTLVEMAVAIIILSVTVLGLAASTGKVMTASSEISLRAEALQAAESRLSVIQMDPRYLLLDSIYGGMEQSLPGLDGYTRLTTVAHTSAVGDPGRIVDYKTITVTVSAVGMKPVIRTIILGAP
jgi:prepilin-type N-terminal cleavage/methylation domain-containing protein